MNPIHSLSVAVIATLMLTLTACQTGSSLRVGPSFAATSADQVQVLTEKPLQSHIVLGLVEASAPQGLLQGRNTANQNALNELRQQAASLGANAVIVKGIGRRETPLLIDKLTDDTDFIFTDDRQTVEGTAIRFNR